MPYSTVADLPSAFKNLPAGAKAIAMRTMNAILEGKEETKELVTQAVQAAWANIKLEYTQQGGAWVKKWFARKAGPESAKEPDLSATHDMLAAELTRRGKMHRTPMAKAWYVPIAKADADKRIVYGIVLQPGDKRDTDAQDDFVTPDEIEVAAHDFMRRYRAAKATMGVQHEREAPGVDIVENYIAPADFTLNRQEVLKGSWVTVAYVGDDKVWAKVKDGSLSGFSIGGRGERVAA